MDGRRSATANAGLSDTEEMDEDEDYDSDATNMSADFNIASEGCLYTNYFRGNSVILQQLVSNLRVTVSFKVLSCALIVTIVCE